MKISTYLEIILVIGVVFFIFGNMITESGQRYPDAGFETNNSAFTQGGTYDFSNAINNSVYPLQQKLSVLSSSDEGWFSKISSGLAAIPYAVILLPTLAIQSLGYGITILTGGLVAFGLPSYILSVVIIMLLVWGIIKLIEIFQRYPI